MALLRYTYKLCVSVESVQVTDCIDRTYRATQSTDNSSCGVCVDVNYRTVVRANKSVTEQVETETENTCNDQHRPATLCRLCDTN